MGDSYTRLLIRLRNNTAPPLFVAAFEGLPLCTEFLLRICKVDVNEVFLNNTPLLLAIMRKHVSVIEILLKHPNVQVNRGRQKIESTPLLRALARSKEIARLLLSRKDLDINETNQGDNSPYLVACHTGDVDALELLLRHKNLDAKHVNRQGLSASHVACQAGHVKVVALLMQHELFQFYVRDKTGNIPLDKACNKGQLRTAQLLLEVITQTRLHIDHLSESEGPDIIIHALEEDIFGALFYACWHGYLQLTKLLLSYIDFTRHNHYEQINKCLNTAISYHRQKVAIELISILCKSDGKEKAPLIKGHLRRLFWSLHKTLTRRLYSAWLDLLRNDYSKRYDSETHENAVSVETELIKEISRLFENSSPETELTDKEAYMLYHAIRYDMHEVIALLLDHFKSINLDRISTKLKYKGISLIAYSAKNSKTVEVLKTKFQDLPVSIEKEVDLFKAWYELERYVDYSVPTRNNDVPQLKLSQIEDLVYGTVSGNLEETAQAFKKLQKIIWKETESETNEKELIYDTVRSFIRTLIEDICQQNALFNCTPKQVGSSKEGTRPFKPDEFDFIFLLEQIQRFLETRSTESDPCSVCLKVKANCEQLHEYTLENGDFDVTKFKTCMDECFIKACVRAFSNGSFAKFLFMDPVFYEMKNISCFHLNWRGEVYKDMKIDIDLVPAFKLNDYKSPCTYTTDPCEYYAFCKPGVFKMNTAFYPVAFSDVELKLLSELPGCARNALKLAKAMRISDLFPHTIVDQFQEVFSIDDCLKTYMLKTSLLHCYKVFRTKMNEDELLDIRLVYLFRRRLRFTTGDIVGPYSESSELSVEEWAYVTYLHLEMRIILGSLPSLFSFTPDFVLFQCDDAFEIDILYERQCCMQRKNLLLITCFLRIVLEQYIREKGKLVWLRRIALAAAQCVPARMYCQ